MSNYTPPNLPLKADLESKVVLKQVAAAHRRLAELKGLVMTMNMYPFRHSGYITEQTCTRFVHFGYMSMPICIQKSNKTRMSFGQIMQKILKLIKASIQKLN